MEWLPPRLGRRKLVIVEAGGRCGSPGWAEQRLQPLVRCGLPALVQTVAQVAVGVMKVRVSADPSLGYARRHGNRHVFECHSSNSGALFSTVNGRIPHLSGLPEVEESGGNEDQLEDRKVDGMTGQMSVSERTLLVGRGALRVPMPSE